MRSDQAEDEGMIHYRYETSKGFVDLLVSSHRRAPGVLFVGEFGAPEGVSKDLSWEETISVLRELPKSAEMPAFECKRRCCNAPL